MWIRVIMYFLLVTMKEFIFTESAEEPTNSLKRQTSSSDQENCTVSLPQDSPKECSPYREEELKKQKGLFQLAKRFPFPTPLVNMSIQQFVNYHKQDPFAKNEFLGYVTMLQNIREFRTNWMKDHLNVDIKEFQEYEDMFKAFRSNLKSNSTGDLDINVKCQSVSDKETLNPILKDWRDDGIFAEQRVSGTNTMILRRVTDDSTDVGLSWSELKKTLNPNYNWESAIQNATGSNEPLEEAIKKGNVYVLRYEVFDDMVSFDDTVDKNPGRTLWPTKSPVALFSIKSQMDDKRLRPAAIQIDFKPDSPVFSPMNGGSWMLAKWAVQATDYAYSQIIEHLLKIHLLMEPFCVVLYRQLSLRHPLNQLLKYHCRGLLATNAIGGPKLVKPGGYMDILTAMGRIGTIKLLERGYKTLSWKDADFHGDIKKRGLDDKNLLPYFPYRDDSELLLMAIERMVQDYVYAYYRSNNAVKEDKELQAFVNELSVDGSGPDGGNGEVKDFPAELTTRDEVVDIVTKMIWLLSVKHAAVNYPVADYGGFTPILPTKVYNDTRVPPGVSSVFNLANVNISVEQVSVAMNIGLYHYDTLFDYYDELPDPAASRIIQFYHDYFKHAITPLLKYRNRRRLLASHLSYPYLQFPCLPNGIQT